MSDPALFAFVDPAMQIIATCAAVFVLLLFFSALSDVVHARMHSRRAACDDVIAARPER